MDDSTKFIFYWILITFVLSAIIGVFWGIVALFQRKTMEQSFYLFIHSLFGGLLGGLLGSIVGLVIGSIIIFVTSAKPDFISYDIIAIMMGIIAFFICWIIGILIGGIKFGISDLNKSGN